MAPDAWSKKRERQYQKIKKSEVKRGRSEDRAEEIAARTVNKTRRKLRETESGKKSSSGSGKPGSRLENRSKQELYNLAKKREIKGRSSMSKQELIHSLR